MFGFGGLKFSSGIGITVFKIGGTARLLAALPTNTLASDNKYLATKYLSTTVSISSNFRMSPIPAPMSDASNTNNKTQRPLLKISVDGNISSGKSTLVSSLVDLFPENFNFEVEIVPEPLAKWTNMQGHNLLDMLYKDVSKHNFKFQHYVQLTRLIDTIKDIRDQDSEPVSDEYSGKIRIMERSLQNNRYCFSELARRQGTLQEAEFAVLAEWYKWLEEHVDLTLDLVIYLRTSPEVVFDRMKSRGRAEEDPIPFKYLSDLHDTYEDWLVRGNIVEESNADLNNDDNHKKQKIIVIDANRGKTEVAHQCKQLIKEFWTNTSKLQNGIITTDESTNSGNISFPPS